MALKLNGQQVEDLIHLGFNSGDRRFMQVEELREGFARTRLPFRNSMLRPGEVVSGPALFTAADTAMYALVLGHLGAELMSLTSDFTMHFLNKARKGDVIAEAKMLKLGRRLAVMEVALYTSAEPQTLVAHVTGSFVLPVKAAK